jgi:hypothetical protein
MCVFREGMGTLSKSLGLREVTVAARDEAPLGTDSRALTQHRVGQRI